MGATVGGAAPGFASLLLAAAVAASAELASGATAEISVTVPRKTVSSDCRPGHFPGGCLEQVQACSTEGGKKSRSAAASNERCIMKIYLPLARARKSRNRAVFLRR